MDLPGQRDLRAVHGASVHPASLGCGRHRHGFRGTVYHFLCGLQSDVCGVPGDHGGHRENAFGYRRADDQRDAAVHSGESGLWANWGTAAARIFADRNQVHGLCRSVRIDSGHRDGRGLRGDEALRSGSGGSEESGKGARRQSEADAPRSAAHSALCLWLYIQYRGKHSALFHACLLF